MTLAISNSIVSTASNTSAVPILVDYSISQITTHVFVTAEETARQFQYVFLNGIGCVINVANELPQIVFPPQSGIESLKYPVEDNPVFPVFRYFDMVADRIAANVASNRRTLLYCHHGRSRSVTFILAYLIKHHRLPLTTAFAIVRQKRQIALPNVGFWSQLMSYESRQRQNASPRFNNQHTPLQYGQQVLHKIFGGLEQVLFQNPIVNAFTNSMHSMNRRSHVHPYYRVLRRRPPSYPYHVQIPPGIYQRPYF